MRIGRTELAWAFYDWANSAFATTVMAGFFPVFFKQYWAAGLTPTDSSFQLGLGNSHRIGRIDVDPSPPPTRSVPPSAPCCPRRG